MRRFACWRPVEKIRGVAYGGLFVRRPEGPVFSSLGGPRAAGETSPSLVYGAALLMRLGF